MAGLTCMGYVDIKTQTINFAETTLCQDYSTATKGRKILFRMLACSTGKVLKIRYRENHSEQQPYGIESVRKLHFLTLLQTLRNSDIGK